MSNYTKTTNFGAKDGLSTGDSNKLVKGSEFDTEFDAIATAVSTKADAAAPTLTGTTTASALTVNSTFKLGDTSADHYYTWAVNELAADRTVTWPLLTGNDTIVFNAHTATLTNKTINMGSNTLTGTAAQFDTAVSDDNFLFSSDLIDDDTFATATAANIPSAESVKAYVDASVGGTVDTSGTPIALDFARFTDADTIEGRSYSEVRSDLGLVIGTNVQAYDAGLTDIAALAVTDGNIIVGDGANWVAESGATARTSLGLTIGTNVQAYDAGLTSISGLTTAANKMIYTTGSDTYAVADLTAFARTLLDDSDQATAAHTLLDNTTLTAATVAASDKILIQDVDGSGVLKTATAQSIADLSSGDWVFLAAADAANDATIDFTDSTAGVLDGTYDTYALVFTNVIPATDGAFLYSRVSEANTFATTGYDYEYNKSTSGVASAADGQNQGAGILAGAGPGNAAGEAGASGVIYISGAASGVHTKWYGNVVTINTAGLLDLGVFACKRNTTTNTDGFRVYFSTGNITSGAFAIYGLARS